MTWLTHTQKKYPKYDDEKMTNNFSTKCKERGSLRQSSVMGFFAGEGGVEKIKKTHKRIKYTVN